MEITTVITERVKDIFTLSKSIAKVVKEEVEMYMNKDEDEDDSYESSSKEELEDDKSSVMEYIQEFETKVKDLIQTAFTGFKSSKKEEQKELESRISALEEKLSKLVEESMEAFRKEDANRI